MTPTLLGRWQTRVATLALWGSLISLCFALGYTPDPEDSFTEQFFTVVLFVGLFGLAWDVLWIGLQTLRWDRDWPAAFQVMGAAVEALFIYLFIEQFGLPGIPDGAPPAGVFSWHYGLIWACSFFTTQGPMRALFPRWRFSGGRIV